MRNDKEQSTITENDISIDDKYSELFNNSTYDTGLKLENFPKYVKRQNLTYFISKYEIFKKIINIHGSIVECGVLYGGSLMTWGQLSSIFEPLNHQRKIIGFDTFEGFQSETEIDKGKSSILDSEGMKLNNMQELEKAIEIYDDNRSLSHINKIELVKGDLTTTAKKYIEDNPHLVISLLYLDCDIYQPTKAALEVFLPRMPRGAVIVFDELNVSSWPGETMAVLEEVGIRNIKIERFAHDTNISYAVLD